MLGTGKYDGCNDGTEYFPAPRTLPRAQAKNKNDQFSLASLSVV